MYFPLQVSRRVRVEFAGAAAALLKARLKLRQALSRYRDAKYRRLACDPGYDVDDSGSSTWTEGEEEEEEEEEEEDEEDAEEEEDEHAEEEEEEEEESAE